MKHAQVQALSKSPRKVQKYGREVSLKKILNKKQEKKPEEEEKKEQDKNEGSQENKDNSDNISIHWVSEPSDNEQD